MKRPGAKAGRDQHSYPRGGKEGSPPSSWPRYRGRCTYRVGAHRLGDILHAVAAERTVIEIELVPDLVVNGLRDADGAGLGERLEPGGDVDAIAKDVVPVDDDIAEINPDPQLEPALGRDRVVDGARGALHLDGAAQRVDDARKIRQYTVACRPDDPPAMRRDQRVDGGAELVQGLMRAGLILAHQTAEPDHIRMQYGRELSLPGGRFPRRTRRVIEHGAHRGCV